MSNPSMEQLHPLSPLEAAKQALRDSLLREKTKKGQA